MTIHSSDRVRQPMLKHLAQAGGPVKLSVLTKELGRHFGLTEQEMNMRIDSGRRQFHTRATTAVLDLKKNGSVEIPGRGYWEITPIGREEADKIPQASREEIQADDLEWANGVDNKFFYELLMAYLGKNEVTPEQLPDVIAIIRQALGEQPTAPTTHPPKPAMPAVPIEESITDEHLVCLECGRHFKTLRRHLGSHHQLTPEQYRRKWGLSPKYPMVSQSLAAFRSQKARKSLLGHKG